MKRAPRTKAAVMPPLPDLDPIVAETIERTMRPYLGLLPEEGLLIMRDRLVEALTTHPVALDALAQMRKEPGAGGSGTRVRRDDEEGEEP